MDMLTHPLDYLEPNALGRRPQVAWEGRGPQTGTFLREVEYTP